MITRLLIAGIGLGLLFCMTPIAQGADAPRAQRTTNVAVARSTSLKPPRLASQPATKILSTKSKAPAGRLQLNPQPEPPGNSKLLAEAKSAGRRTTLVRPPARQQQTGPRSSSGILQLLPTPESESTNQKVYTLIRERQMTDAKPATLMQFGSEEDSENTAEIMPLETSEQSEPGAYILQFDSSDD